MRDERDRDRQEDSIISGATRYIKAVNKQFNNMSDGWALKGGLG
jgi:hypothetical protein